MTNPWGLLWIVGLVISSVLGLLLIDPESNNQRYGNKLTYSKILVNGDIIELRKQISECAQKQLRTKVCKFELKMVVVDKDNEQ